MLTCNLTYYKANYLFVIVPICVLWNLYSTFRGIFFVASWVGLVFLYTALAENKPHEVKVKRLRMCLSLALLIMLLTGAASLILNGIVVGALLSLIHALVRVRYGKSRISRMAFLRSTGWWKASWFERIAGALERRDAGKNTED